MDPYTKQDNNQWIHIVIYQPRQEPMDPYTKQDKNQWIHIAIYQPRQEPMDPYTNQDTLASGTTMNRQI